MFTNKDGQLCMNKHLAVVRLPGSSGGWGSGQAKQHSIIASIILRCSPLHRPSKEAGSQVTWLMQSVFHAELSVLVDKCIPIPLKRRRSASFFR